MKPHAAAIGDRYDDDSGWERHVEIDTNVNSLYITLRGERISADATDIEWLIVALEKLVLLTTG